METEAENSAKSLYGVVLSGGGARGAYEAGVLSGIVRVLAKRGERVPFRVSCGSSVGAIHAAWIAANCHRQDLNIDALTNLWSRLELRKHLRVDPLGVMRSGRWSRYLGRDTRARGLLDPGALEQLVSDNIEWLSLRNNVDEGRVRALIVSALHIRTGTTVLFSDVPEGAGWPASKHARRKVVPTRISADHVLASASLPILFPPRKIDDAFYWDGGIRYNTPIAPALRAGCNHLLVIPLLSEGTSGPPRSESSPSLSFMLGKLFNALLLDPVRYDLSILERTNRLLASFEQELTPTQLAHFHNMMRETRGAAYQRVRTLVFRPSKDIGALAKDHASSLRPSDGPAWLLSRFEQLGSIDDTDLLSFVLFDGKFARTLIELGQADVFARADEVESFCLE